MISILNNRTQANEAARRRGSTPASWPLNRFRKISERNCTTKMKESIQEPAIKNNSSIPIIGSLCSCVIRKSDQKPKKSVKNDKLTKQKLIPEKSTSHLYATSRCFKDALELFNRLNAVEIPQQSAWRGNQVFYECKGALRVAQKLCSQCCDAMKRSVDVDLYYVNLAETTRSRNVLCRRCMEERVYVVVGNDRVNIEKQLKGYRRLQKAGIVIVPNL